MNNSIITMFKTLKREFFYFPLSVAGGFELSRLLHGRENIKTMETWKDIPGYEGRYKVSNFGIVKRLDYSYIHSYKPRGWQHKEWKMIYKEKIVPGGIVGVTKVGPYHRVGLNGIHGKSNFLVHRLVYCTFNNIPLKFMGQKSKTLILHKDDDPNNNSLDNLFLGTQKDNIADMDSKNRRKRGRAKHNKIGFSDLPMIRKKHEELGSVHRVGEYFGVSGATISRAMTGKIWNLDYKFKKQFTHATN